MNNGATVDIQISCHVRSCRVKTENVSNPRNNPSCFPVNCMKRTPYRIQVCDTMVSTDDLQASHSAPIHTSSSQGSLSC